MMLFNVSSIALELGLDQHYYQFARALGQCMLFELNRSWDDILSLFENHKKMTQELNSTETTLSTVATRRESTIK